MNKILAFIARLISIIVLVSGGVGLNLVEASPVEASAVGNAASARAGQPIQFTSAGHLLAFSPQDVMIASAGYMLKTEFVNANQAVPHADSGQASDSNDSKAAPLGTVTYDNLWNGVDLAYEAADGSIAKSTYYLENGDAVRNIHLRYNRPVVIDGDGNLVVNFEAGTLKDSPPVAWQLIDNNRKPVTAAWTQYNENEVGFCLGEYIPGLPVVIDPWLSFLGDGNWVTPTDIALDWQGNVYITGNSSNSWGSPVRAFSGSDNAFVAKLDPQGNLLWNTFLGDDYDKGNSIAADGWGNVYVTGLSFHSWGNPVRAITGNDGDAFVAKLDTNGNLKWNTFLGGFVGTESGEGITVDGFGSYIYVTGTAFSSWGTPVRSFGGYINAFVAKLDSSGALQWNTFLSVSPNHSTKGKGIAIDWSNNIYVCGCSNDTWGSPLMAFSGRIGGFDENIFVAKFNSSGALQWNTFMNGQGSDYGSDIAADAWGNVYLTGMSKPTWGPSAVASTTSEDNPTGFAAKFDTNGKLQWNKFLLANTVNAISLDVNNNIYILGENGFRIAGFSHTTVVKLDSSGKLLWDISLNRTQSGDSFSPYGVKLVADGSGNSYVTGQNGSWGELRPVPSSSSGMTFVVQIDPNGSLVPPSIEVDGNSTQISNGDTSPSASDYTDFGSSDINTGKVVRTFTIENTGGSDLILNGTPKAVISGTNASDFTVTAQPASPVTAGSSTTFQVTFDPSSIGIRTATFSIAGNDIFISPYTFAIQGRGVKTLTVNGITANNKIYDGTTAATLNTGNAVLSGVSGSDKVALVAGSATGSFADKNAGSGKTVTVSGLTLSGADAGNYTLTQPTTTASITAAATTVTLTSSANPSASGRSITFTAVVSAPSGTPTGTVAFKDGNTILSTVSLSNGQAVYTTSSLSVATHIITAVYNGDANYTGSTSNAVSQLINKSGTTTSLTGPKGAVNYGQSITFTATVTASSGTPTGTVTFVDGTTALGSVSLNNGVSTYSTSVLSVGTHSITAVYNGDAISTGSTSAVVSQLINKAGTTTKLTGPQGTVSYGQPITFTATISASSGTPTGTVTFKDGNTVLSTVNLSNKQAVYTTSSLPVATHIITAVYNGDASYTASTSVSVNQVIDKISPTLTLVSDLNPSATGQTVTFTATVTAPSGTPTGTVIFADGMTALSTVNLVNGTAIYSTSDLSVATHNIIAVYPGDSNYKSIISNTVSQVVNQSYVYGQMITFTAKMSSSGGAPIGSVMFVDGNTVMSTEILSNGQAVYSTSKLSVSTHRISVIYSGNSPFASSNSSTFVVVVNKADTTITLTPSARSASQGESDTFTAAVSVSAPGAGTPTGTVTFMDGSTNLGTMFLSNGRAVFYTVRLGTGTHTIKAIYNGDANYAGSTTTLNQTITPADSAGE